MIGKIYQTKDGLFEGKVTSVSSDGSIRITCIKSDNSKYIPVNSDAIFSDLYELQSILVPKRSFKVISWGKML